MANICRNQVTVHGPENAVRWFVEAAKGKNYDEGLIPFATEVRIIDEVRNGKSIAEAFRDANNRIDTLNMAVSNYNADYLHGTTPILNPVDEADFEAWADGIQLMRKRIEADVRPPEDSWLSVVSLVPMPAEIASETYHLAQIGWLLDHRGCKYVYPVGEPAVERIDVSSDSMGFSGPDEVAIATYPAFDTENAPPFAALVAASSAHPDIVFLASFADTDTDDYRFMAAKAGEELALRVMGREELPPSCFERDEEGDVFVLVEAVLGHLMEHAHIEADEVGLNARTSGSSPKPTSSLP